MADESLFRLGSLCVVGNINRDVKTSPIGAGDGILRDGETAVASIVETVGGGGANSACAAAALGARVAFLGKVGADDLGRRLERTLRAWGVAPRLAKDAGTTTGTSIALAHESGQRHFLSCLPNNAALRLEDLDLAAIRGFRHLYRADVWFSEAMLHGGNERLFRAAREAGMTVSVDVNWDPLWGRAPADRVASRKLALCGVLHLVDLVHGNERELGELTGCRDLESSCRALADRGAGAVVAHLGAAGAGYWERGAFVAEGPAPVERHVETTGTGDVLSVGMMLLHEVEGIDVREKLRLSNRVVAEFIQGERPLIPRIE